MLESWNSRLFAWKILLFILFLRGVISLVSASRSVCLPVFIYFYPECTCAKKLKVSFLWNCNLFYSIVMVHLYGLTGRPVSNYSEVMCRSMHCIVR